MMLTIKKFDERFDDTLLNEGNRLVQLDFKNHGYIMPLTLKATGQLIVWLFNRNTLRPFAKYVKA